MADNHPAISDEMIRVWRMLKAIKASGTDWHWEDEGGRRREYFDLNTRLNHELMGMMPHETPPIRAAVCGPPPADGDEAGWKRFDVQQQWQKESYRRAHRLALLLDKAANVKRQRSIAREREPTP